MKLTHKQLKEIRDRTDTASDTQFITHARTDILELLAEIERMDALFAKYPVFSKGDLKGYIARGE